MSDNSQLMRFRIDEEVDYFPIQSLQEVPWKLINQSTFAHPVKHRPRLLLSSEELQMPTREIGSIHRNSVRRCNWVEVDGKIVLEGPMLATYCPDCQIFFYALDINQEIAEVDELTRLSELPSREI